MFAVLLILLLLLHYLFLKVYLKARKLPPGPIPLPIVGNIPQIAWGAFQGRGIIATMEVWKKTYGPVHTFWLGPVAVVNICDWSIAQEAMVKKGNIFLERANPFLHLAMRKGLGIITSNGQHWSEQRRFALHSLRNFGLGRGIMEERIMLEVDYRCHLLNKEIEMAGGVFTFDPLELIDLTVGNVINRILFTERFTEEREKRFFEMKDIMETQLNEITVIDLMLDEWTAKLPFFKKRLEVFTKPHDDLVAFFREQIAQKRAAIASGKYELKGDGEDFVDAYLIKMDNNEKEGIIDSFNEDTLEIVLVDIWSAGQDTTAKTLYWALSYLVLHPEMIETLEKELISVTGGKRTLSLNDRQATPYFNAVIMETLRLSSIVSLNLWRESSSDVIVGDYLIPKGTAVTAQLSVIMKDKKTFEDPEKFDPSRFLGENAVDVQQLVPFGMGKRVCPGEALARAEIYLILGNIVSAYEISQCPEAMPKLSAVSDFKGSFRKAHPFAINIRKREF